MPKSDERKNILLRLKKEAADRIETAYINSTFKSKQSMIEFLLMKSIAEVESESISSKPRPRGYVNFQIQEDMYDSLRSFCSQNRIHISEAKEIVMLTHKEY